MIRVLIADDSRTMRDIVKRAFSQAFPAETFEFDEVADGQQLYDKAVAGGTWSVIATDWNMPEMTGIETLERFKAEGRLKSLPPVGFVTSECTQAMKARAEQIPTSFFLTRPLSVDEFKNTFGPIVDKKA